MPAQARTRDRADPIKLDRKIRKELDSPNTGQIFLEKIIAKIGFMAPHTFRTNRAETRSTAAKRQAAELYLQRESLH